MLQLPQEEERSILALSMVKGIGFIIARNLIEYLGSARAVWETPPRELLRIPGIYKHVLKAIRDADVFATADAELAWMYKNNVQFLHFWHPEYPERLRHCPDAPLFLCYRGNGSLNHHRQVAIVGTRHATPYGRRITEELVAGLLELDCLIVSGLAYGIDIAAHKAALDNGLQTIGVVAHGLDRVYPAMHKEVARQMEENGGLLTEILPGNDPDRQNFPRRNRIVAGMVDALVVVESGENGGAIITASLANGYNRDVFAFPGQVHHAFSQGCNLLIQRQQAQLITCADDLVRAMNWKSDPEKKKGQRQLFLELNAEEKLVYDILRNKGELHIDDLTLRTGLSPGTLAGTLLSLEFQGVIQTLPGKRYKLD